MPETFPHDRARRWRRRLPGLVIFDCDGVLVDSEPLSMRVLLETIAEAGGVIDVAEGL